MSKLLLVDAKTFAPVGVVSNRNRHWVLVGHKTNKGRKTSIPQSYL